MILEALIDRIIALGHAQAGRERNIFAAYMPATRASGILLRLPLDGVEVNNEMPGYYRTRLQIIVRDTDYSRGDALAVSLFRELPMRQEADLGERFLVKQLLPQSQPIAFPRLEGNSHEWSLNFWLTYVDREEIR